jgi:hypothetical protein
MIEQCDVIKFFADKGRAEIEIYQRLKDHYGDSAMSRREVYRWIRDIKEGRGERTSKRFHVQEGRQTKDFPG